MDVAIVGTGQLARGVAAILSRRADVHLIGPSDRSQQSVALSSGADVVIIATTTRLADVAPAIESAILAGSNVIVSAEESAFPWAVDSAAGDRLNALALSHDVTVLGSGLNPGFVFDALVLTLTGVCASVDSISATRTVGLGAFGHVVQARLGLGVDKAAFTAGVASGEILGHAGFPQSMSIVASKLGLTLDTIGTLIEPIMEHGQSVGVRQVYTGVVDGAEWYRATFLGHIDPQSAGLRVRDEIEILGSAPVNCVIDPGIGSQSGSQAIIANSVNRVIAARAGWLTVADLPPAHPLMAAKGLAS